jgi:hypothetical protein
MARIKGREDVFGVSSRKRSHGDWWDGIPIQRPVYIAKLNQSQDFVDL